MDRRKFIVSASMASMALYIKPQHVVSNVSTASELNRLLRSLYDIKEPSVDRVVVGDPLTRIKKIGTAWTPYLKTLKLAAQQGVNVMVVHEPTFYTHWDLDRQAKDFSSIPSPAKDNYLEAIEQKKKWIEENGMVIIRSHDVPDILKEFGIPYAFGQALGFKNRDIVRSKDYYNVYQVPQDTAGNIAKKIAKSLKKFGQPGVAFYGDASHMVATVGLGTGCICNPQLYDELYPDLTIGIDDTIRTWIQTTYSEDTGKPLIVVNHGTSEEMGMQLLSEYLKKAIPSYPVIHFEQGCSYKWIPA